jgi:hypothetical protein
MMKLLKSVTAIAAVCLSTVAGVSRAQGVLRLFTDPALTQCSLSDTAPGLVNVYIAELSASSLAARFRVEASPGFTGIWVSDASPFQLLGSSPTDANLFFGTCQAGNFLILTVTYQLFGTSTCSQLAIAPSVGQPIPICYGCFDPSICHNNRPLYVNCGGTVDCYPLAANPSTWGTVKALYRD